MFQSPAASSTCLLKHLSEPYINRARWGQALRPDATEEAMPPVSDAAAAVLVSIGFRNSSEVCRVDVHWTCVSCLDTLRIVARLLSSTSPRAQVQKHSRTNKSQQMEITLCLAKCLTRKSSAVLADTSSSAIGKDTHVDHAFAVLLHSISCSGMP